MFLGMFLGGLFSVAWYIVSIIQGILGYGTAYRRTKRGGDDGAALFGWMIVYCGLAALIPGLGFYLWSKSKKNNHAIPPAAYTTTTYASAAQALPGWYPDPSGEPGKQRYWDGQRWV
jgi:hypothetical protein